MQQCILYLLILCAKKIMHITTGLLTTYIYSCPNYIKIIIISLFLNYTSHDTKLKYDHKIIFSKFYFDDVDLNTLTEFAHAKSKTMCEYIYIPFLVIFFTRRKLKTHYARFVAK